jgi:hypothetical protein
VVGRRERAGMPLAGDLQSPAGPNGPAKDMETLDEPTNIHESRGILAITVVELAKLPDRVGALELRVSALESQVSRELGGRIDDLGTHMRVLHGEVISRIALRQNQKLKD